MISLRKKIVFLIEILGVIFCLSAKSYKYHWRMMDSTRMEPLVNGSLGNNVNKVAILSGPVYEDRDENGKLLRRLFWVESYEDRTDPTLVDEYGNPAKLKFNNPFREYTENGEKYRYCTHEGRSISAWLVYYYDGRSDKVYVGFIEKLTDTFTGLSFDNTNRGRQDAKDFYFLFARLLYKFYHDDTWVDWWPNVRGFYTDEPDTRFGNTCVEFPKEIISEFFSTRHTVAFMDGELFYNKEWHDLKNGQTVNINGYVYSMGRDGELYENSYGKPKRVTIHEVDWENTDSINNIFRMDVYHDSNKVYDYIKNGKGYWYCQGCFNFHRHQRDDMNRDPIKFSPIEYYGSHSSGMSNDNDINNYRYKAAIVVPVYTGQLDAVDYYSPKF